MLDFFYRATLSVSAVFTDVRCPSVHPSARQLARPSVHLLTRSCIQAAKDMVKHLSRTGSPIILVFFYASASTQSQGLYFFHLSLFLGRIMEKLETDFHKIQWIGGTWATEESIRLLL